MLARSATSPASFNKAVSSLALFTFFQHNEGFFAQGIRATQQLPHNHEENARIIFNTWNLAKNTHSIIVTLLAWAPARRSLREAKEPSSTKTAAAGRSTHTTPLSVASPGPRTPFHLTYNNIPTLPTRTYSQQPHLYNRLNTPVSLLPRIPDSSTRKPVWPLLTFRMFALGRVYDIQA